MIGLSAEEVRELGQYNAEKARGLMHTLEWCRRMAELQQRFDIATRAGYQELAHSKPLSGTP